MSSRYVIVPTADLTQQMVDDCVDTSLDSLRKSLNGLSTVLEYQGDKPASLASYTDYSHEDTLGIMSTDAWSGDAI